MVVLGIECTATPVSCAIIDDGKLKGEYFLNLKTTHSQTLMPMVESMLSLCGYTISDVDAVAATVGPGSFTGVRIGISAVKGLAFAEDKPCVPVSVLEAMAYAFLQQNCIVCAVMDARCNQVYNALFDVDGEKCERICEDRALYIDDLYQQLVEISQKNPQKCIFIVGDGANLFYNSVKGEDLNLKLAPEHLRWQRASCVCLAAVEKLNNGQTVTPKELLPLYLRLPQAERELKAKMQKKEG